MKKNLYSQLRTKNNLTDAWKKVYRNGVKSKSIDTQKAVKKFNIEYDTKIGTIQKQLYEDRYKFKPSTGIPIFKSGKDPRPIVLWDIRDRVVQRAILNIIQSQDSVKVYVNVPTSFGGIEGKSVRKAILHVCNSINSGLVYHITSDIQKFFTRIPRTKVIDILTNLLPDQSLIEILDQASKTELDNLSQLGTKKELFPTYELGVAQGCCLSPLFGNIVLHEFDKNLNSNSKDIVCYRYIDDFIILGRSDSLVTKAFSNAVRLLTDLNMGAYLPTDGSGKARQGKISNRGLDYLGCSISTSFVHPNKKSRNAIKRRVKLLLKDRSSRLKSIQSNNWDVDYSSTKTLQDVSNILMGWGNQYSFCNSKRLFGDIDIEINKYLNEYFSEYSRIKKELTNNNNIEGLRKLLGVHLLSESNCDPILPLGH